ncbi:tRNA-(msio[6]A)-hydroxylase [Oleiphilus messinensis]|uniref:tRNA-(Msio[6]A)-hydroxylase n=1 Tax=Oleiphilus messinensis TaxID=141451 RepID=A0A1Y0I725_9GAMM|nr:tRNA-(ms[2]io[6]A)-hydroxylase [Oleiphilus messinensis]ARU56298.1 tRNA-(msio[6]A)-hydroxylase [Oleiphilus messinensis]
MVDLTEIKAFLACETPAKWVENALANQPLMLIDHAHCEKKAASTALNLMYRYVDKPDLLNKMSRLAREELRHFEQVLAIMQKRGIAYDHLSPARYAGGLRAHCRTSDPGKLIDTLIVGAFIEARSCERFACVAPFLDHELQQFYMSLLKSESRHFKDYLKLASKYSDEPINERVAFFAEAEARLILDSDDEFRFHSGPVKTDAIQPEAV